MKNNSLSPLLPARRRPRCAPASTGPNKRYSWVCSRKHAYLSTRMPARSAPHTAVDRPAKRSTRPMLGPVTGPLAEPGALPLAGPTAGAGGPTQRAREGPAGRPSHTCGCCCGGGGCCCSHCCRCCCRGEGGRCCSPCCRCCSRCCSCRGEGGSWCGHCCCCCCARRAWRSSFSCRSRLLVTAGAAGGGCAGAPDRPGAAGAGGCLDGTPLAAAVGVPRSGRLSCAGT